MAKLVKVVNERLSIGESINLLRDPRGFLLQHPWTDRAINVVSLAVAVGGWFVEGVWSNVAGVLLALVGFMVGPRVVERVRQFVTSSADIVFGDSAKAEVNVERPETDSETSANALE